MGLAYIILLVLSTECLVHFCSIVQVYYKTCAK